MPGKPRRLLSYAGGVGTYRRKCDEVAASGYAGSRSGSSTSARAGHGPTEVSGAWQLYRDFEEALDAGL